MADHTRIKQPDGKSHKMTPMLTMCLLESHHCCPHVITATARATKASRYLQYSQMWNLDSKVQALLFSLTNSYVCHSTLPTPMHFSHMRGKQNFKKSWHLVHFQPHMTHFFPEKYLKKSPCVLTTYDKLLHKNTIQSIKTPF